MNAVALAPTKGNEIMAMAPAERTSIEYLVARLEDAWNAGDGARFAQPFTEDADFVNIFGRHVRGWWAIAEGHEWIFRNVYLGSRATYTVAQVRLLKCDTALVHLRAHLSVPGGVMAGEHDSLPSLLLIREGDEWKIVAFHNTLITSPLFQR